MQQDKSPNMDATKLPPIAYKKRIYKLKNISYMSLSLMYIALIVLTTVLGLILIATFIAKDHYIGMFLSLVVVIGIIMSIYRIGIKYGEYGLEIILGKAFQQKHIKNDFPRIEGPLLLDLDLFPQQTLTKEKETDTDKKGTNPNSIPSNKNHYLIMTAIPLLSRFFKAAPSQKYTCNLSEKIPIWKVEKHLLLSKNQALSTVLELTMPEAYSLTGDSLKDNYLLFNRIIKAIPKGYIVHKQDYYNQKRYYADKEGNTFLARAYEAKFNKRRFYNHKSYLVITKAPNADQFVSNFMTSFVTGRFVQKDISQGLVEFENTVRKVMHILKSGGIGTQILRGKAVTDLLNIYFNLGKSHILQDIQVKNDHLTIGKNEVLLYNSVGAEIDLPKHFDINLNLEEFVDRSFSFPLGIGLNSPHIVNTIIRKNDPNILVKMLAATREKIMSMSLKSRQNAQLVDEYDHFLSDVIKTGETPVYVSQNVLLWGQGERLLTAENELNNALAKMDIYTQRNFNCANLFWGCCPGNTFDLPKSEFQIQLSDAASMLFPIETNPKNNGLYGLKMSEKDFGIPIILDMWDKPMKEGIISNRNMFILGPSGSGKSFFTNHMARQLVEQDYHVTIIDVGGSYRRLCQHKQGKYFEYTASSKMSFNPFYLPRDKFGKFSGDDLDDRENLKTLLFTIWKGDKVKYTKEEYTILSDSLNSYYQHIQEKALPASFNTYYEFLFKQFKPNLKTENRRFFDFDSLNVVFKPYYKGGVYDYLLNNPEEFSISDIQFCVFELDEIRDHPIIFPIVTLVIMDAFITKLKKHKEERKVILIEEAWSAFVNPNMAKFLKYLYKTVRKHNGAIGIITQEIDDIIGSPMIKAAVLNNAPIQVLLDQGKYKNKFSELAGILGLPLSETKKILGLNKMRRPGEKYMEAYIRMGSTGKAYGINVSPFEAAMYTTQAVESAEIDRYIKRYGSVEYGIIRNLEDKDKLPPDFFPKDEKMAS